MKKEVSIVGAGLVGSLWAVFLAQRGYAVNVYEKRPDPRLEDFTGGRSINLALSDRGWRALSTVGLAEKIREMAIAMEGRMIHHTDGTESLQPYGKKGQSIWSVSREGLNVALIDAAEATNNVQFYFNHQCAEVDVDSAAINFIIKAGDKIKAKADAVFGADGAFSAVRDNLMKQTRMDYAQSFLDYNYKELSIPAGLETKWQLYKNALHIWPRRSFMLIALPNSDGSFTCTLFLPCRGKNSFEQLKDETSLTKFFEIHFPDALALMPHIADDFFSNPEGSLVTIKCYPWSYKSKVCLIGDAAHAVVPFYGQGMNCGFEDCTILNELLDKHEDDLQLSISEFEKARKKDADAIAELALKNFVEMRDKVGDKEFLLRKKIEQKLHERYPELFIPVYSMVTFSHRPYSKALDASRKNDKLFEKIFAMPGIEEKWDSDEFLQAAEPLLREL